MDRCVCYACLYLMLNASVKFEFIMHTGLPTLHLFIPGYGYRGSFCLSGSRQNWPPNTYCSSVGNKFCSFSAEQNMSVEAVYFFNCF